jgi:hypothetical protein
MRASMPSRGSEPSGLSTRVKAAAATVVGAVTVLVVAGATSDGVVGALVAQTLTCPHG